MAFRDPPARRRFRPACRGLCRDSTLRMMYRRSFIGLIAGAVVVGATRGSNARSDRIGDIGVQLYTVRHEIQRDFERTLARIAEIGYREVEFIELFGRAPRAVRAMLDRHGLVALYRLKGRAASSSGGTKYGNSGSPGG